MEVRATISYDRPGDEAKARHIEDDIYGHMFAIMQTLDDSGVDSLVWIETEDDMNDIPTGVTREAADGTIVPIPDPRMASTDMHGTMDTVDPDPFYVTDLVDEAKVSRLELDKHPEPYADDDTPVAPTAEDVEG